MKTVKGVSVHSGIAKGIVCLYSGELEDRIPHYSLVQEQVGAELEKLKNAFDTSKSEMRNMIDVAAKNGDRDAVDIFNTHLLMLGDEALYSKIASLIESRLINAEHAVNDVFESYIKKYEAEEGHFKELTHDFIDMRNRVLAEFKLETGKFQCEIGESQPVIVAAKRLTPSMVLGLEKKNTLAFVTQEGGYTSHATIIARSFGVPILFGIDVENELECGLQAVVDASSGKVITDPDAETLKYYELKIEKIMQKQLACSLKKDVSAETKSGQRISLKLNITTPAELILAKDMPHDGIGLLRTEFLFMERDTPPTEEEQVRLYSSVFKDVKDKDITVRLLDLGSDKIPPFLKLPQGTNADMELRGAMAVETFPELYVTQVKALLRANTEGNMKLLFPMVSDVSDLETFRGIIEQAKNTLKKEKVEFAQGKIKEGIMIETPAAVMMADELADKVDFINIGSNDLLAYTLAAARGNMLAEARYHILHPALVKMLEKIARAGKAAKKEVCLCGEIASFE